MQDKECKSIPMDQIVRVECEASVCDSEDDAFIRKFKECEDLCVWIVCKQRTFALEASSKRVRDDWFSALRTVCLSGRDPKDFWFQDDEDSADDLVRLVSAEDVLHDDVKVHGFAAFLVKGDEVKKYKHSKAQDRLVWTDGAMKKLFWGVRSGPGKRKIKGSLNIADIVGVSYDSDQSTSNCAGFNKRMKDAKKLCFSVNHQNRTLDLEAFSEERAVKFVNAIRELISWRDQVNGKEWTDKKKIKSILTKGQVFTKYNEKKGQERIVWVDSKLDHVYWGDKADVYNKSNGKFKSYKAKGFILIDEIVRVVVKKEYLDSSSPAFKNRFNANEDCCLSIDADGRFLDLEAPNNEIRDAWVGALKTILALGKGTKNREKWILNHNEDDNEDYSDDEGKVIEESLSEDDALSLPKIRIPKVIEEYYAQTHKSTPKKDDKAVAIEVAIEKSFPAVKLSTESIQFLNNLQSEIEADRGFLLKVVDNYLQPIWTDTELHESVKPRFYYSAVEGAFGKIISSKKPRIFSDVYAEKDFDLIYDRLTKYKTTSYIAVPIGDDKCIGLLCFANKQDFPFKKDYFQSSHLETLIEKSASVLKILN